MTAAILAKALTVPATPEPRDWIQFLPAGKHEIACTVNGAAKKQTANNTPAAAQALQRDLDALYEAGKRVFIDFNHEGDAASGWVQEFRWDQTEGVQALIHWSDAGLAAIRGKSHLYFSPEWKIDLKTGECLGLLPGRPAGGLVNLPAFENIASVAARLAALSPQPSVLSPTFSAAAEPNQDNNNMKNDLIAAAALASGLITKDQAASDDAGKHTAAAIAALQASAAAGAQAKATTASDLAAAVQAKQAAETELTELKTEMVDGLIASAQARAALPPQDAAAAAEWKELCLLPGKPGASARARLASLPGKLPAPTGAGVTAKQMTPGEETEADKSRAAAVRAKQQEISAAARAAGKPIPYQQAWDQAEGLVPRA